MTAYLAFLMDAESPQRKKAMLVIDEGIEILMNNPDIGVTMEDRPDYYQQLFVPIGKSAYVLIPKIRHLSLSEDNMVVRRTER